MSKIAAAIDLGTTYSRIAVYKDGKLNIIPNSLGDPFTPSIVAILDDIEVVGEETMTYKVDENHKISEIKRLIGKNITDLKEFKEINYNISGNNEKLEIKINRNGKEESFSPEKIISILLKKLIKNASSFIEFPINKAVITIPPYYNEKQKKTIEESAKLAGIEILELLDESIASAYAYNIGTKENIKDSLSPNIFNQNNKNNRKILVCDLGGGMFDTTVLELENGKFTVKANLTDTYLGGNNFDKRLVDLCIRDFCQKMGFEEFKVRKDINALKRLKIQCEKGKKKLSKNDSTVINVYNFFEGQDLYMEITSDRFNEECEDLFLKIEDILEQVLKDSNIDKDNIDNIILAGGSSKIPKIKQILLKKFGSNKIMDKINPDEVIVIGAAWKAQKLAKKCPTNDIIKQMPFSLGVASISKIREERHIGQIMSILIEKNSPIPAKSIKKRYKTIKDNQTFFNIKVYSGEEKYVKDNTLLNEFQLDNLPQGKAKSVSFSITFEVDINGTLIINAEVENNNQKFSEQIQLFNNNKSENSNTIIALKKNPKSKEKLDEIRNLVKIITEKDNSLKNIEVDNEKISCLKTLCDLCKNIINIYEELKNDSENLYEKIFDYTKYLFNYYSQIIILDKEDNCTPEIINKIKEEMSKYINDNIEYLIECFSDLKEEKPKIYTEIIIFCVELLYKEGDKILEERKKYARYYSKKFYQKAENIKKNITEDIRNNKIDFKLKNKLKDIEKNYGTKISEIDSFVKIIKDQVEKKDSQFLPGKSGFTTLNDILMKEEDTYLIVDIFQEMAESLSKGEPSEAEAFCRANIIKINFSLFHNYDFKLYERLNKRIEFIYDRLEIDEEDEPNWHKQLNEINEEIENKKKELESKTIIENEKNEKIIGNINNIFNQKIDENKPREFLDYILENYPPVKFDSNKKEELIQKSFEELFQIIFSKYHPDNYKDKNDYIIYHEIYILLVKIEEKFFKK